MQTMLWNGPAGQAWVDEQELLDLMLEPFLSILLDTTGSARNVLDVGCGTGTTTLALAQERACVGIDISKPMLELARSRAQQRGSSAEFVLADAQLHAFEPAQFDLIVSRFGVMFFEDPVAAFSNLKRAARGRLSFVAWRGPEENPFLTTAEQAAAPLLPELPRARADTPGPFGLCSKDRLAGILRESGWENIEIQPLQVPCGFPSQLLSRYYTRIGPLGQMLPQLDKEFRERLLPIVHSAYSKFLEDDQVRFSAATWLVSAGPQ